MLITSAARPLSRAHGPLVSAVLAADPLSNCLIASRFEQVGMDRAGLGGHFWGVDGGRGGLVFDGSNLVPVTGDPEAMTTIAQLVGRRSRRCASIIGRAELVLPLWDRLSARWGPARDVRPDQPLMALHGTPSVAADPLVRQVGPAELDTYFPAAVAMFTEEVGVDPRWPDNGVSYRGRVAGLMQAGRAFGRFDGDRLVAKAEIGAMSSRVALIQGVWVDPAYRGRGLAAPLMAALVRYIGSLGRVPSLYVNAHNTPARAAYQRVGFTQVGTFATVLF